MDNEADTTDENIFDASVHSSTNVLYGINQLAYPKKQYLGDHNNENKTHGTQARHAPIDFYGTKPDSDNKSGDIDCLQYASNEGSFCHVKLDAILNLKESTKKLLCLLEDIQTKTHSSTFISDNCYRFTDSIRQDPVECDDNEDDCSVYKRLTRKCNCLNDPKYNDFVIHFNENSKYFTSNIGEIIKNLRILKRFVYMGAEYSKHALMFLNEGMTESTHAQRVEITQGCAHADICNVFEDRSIVITCIALPCKYEVYGDSVTQSLAATYIHKLSQLEEGRRYLKFTSKISNEIKKILRKKSKRLETDTVDILNETLNLIHPPITHSSITYYSKPLDEGFGGITVTALLEKRDRMTMNEVFTHLDLLQNMSTKDTGKEELNKFLPTMLYLFKQMLIEYDSSEMNIIVTNILNNIVSKNMIKKPELPRTIVMASTSTEPIKMKNGMNQIPIRKHTKKFNKSKLGLNGPKIKHQNKSKQKVAESAPNLLSKSEKFCKEPKITVIRVPIQEESSDLQ